MTEYPTQREQFLAEGGDNWFANNRTRLESRPASEDLIVRLLDLYGLRPQRVLEIGAGMGARLAEMHRRWGAEVTALEPSAQAGAYMAAHFPAIRHQQAAIPGSGLVGSYDLVIAQFVLEWVDREELLAAVAEIDSLVAEGGYLIVGDFVPTHPCLWTFRRPGEEWIYHIYKQDYPPLFLATGFYRAMATLGGIHETSGLLLQTDLYPLDLNRVSIALLRKSLEASYLQVVPPKPEGSL